MRTHKDLQVRQKAIDLAKRVYALTSHFPRREAYGLAAQMRKTAVSIPGKPGRRVSQGPGSVFGARYPALGVDPVPGPRCQIAGTRHLVPGTRRNARLMLRKTRTRGMHTGSCIHFLLTIH